MYGSIRMYIQVRIRIHYTDTVIRLGSAFNNSQDDTDVVHAERVLCTIHANKHYLITQLIGEQVILYINVTVACIPFFKSFLVKQGIIFAAHQMIIICHVPALVSVRRT